MKTKTNYYNLKCMCFMFNIKNWVNISKFFLTKVRNNSYSYNKLYSI